MVFNSLNFAVFLLLVFILYWFVFKKNAKTQNILLLVASIVFYCMADWKFIFLLAASGFINFYLAKFIAQKKEGKIRSLFFFSGIILNVGLLLYFKYFNFFIQSFVTLFNYSGAGISFTPFHILLPLGISFFTFQMIGYLIDVNNDEIEPTGDLLGFCTYLAYFPKILSGPIERVQKFLPQIQKKREFDYGMAVDGLREILWGLFKKMVIADNCAEIANTIFNSSAESTLYSGSTLVLGALFYTIQIYCDFSGYSDMACGISKLFNIRIVNNFAFPFFSTNIRDFWKKWHISLTSWMMDYIFTPLSFILRKYKKTGLIISILLTFLLVGLWHGANWTFIVFGLLNGFYFIPQILKGSMNKNKIVVKGRLTTSLKEFFGMFGLFILISLTAVFFRAENIGHATKYFYDMLSGLIYSWGYVQTFDLILSKIVLLGVIIIFFIIEWLGREQEYAIAQLGLKWKRPLRWAMYFAIIFAIIFAIVILGGKEQQFVYFQF